jgi:hypothetical protein
VRPDPADDARPGPPFAPSDLARQPRPAPAGAVGAEQVTARGGPAVLVIDRVDRGGRPCTRVVRADPPLARLPAAGAAPAPLDLRVPTCEATLAGMIAVEAGPFIARRCRRAAVGGGACQGATGAPGQAVRVLPRPDRDVERVRALGRWKATLVAAGYALPLYPDNRPALSGQRTAVADHGDRPARRGDAVRDGRQAIAIQPGVAEGGARRRGGRGTTEPVPAP